ncbi:unnamed protein product [Heligmosomoides polygyrus]|uniref:GIY-YIG domain-containing protein n=1 Tax=Heligmosomoides polygyrus TaxID=6339 RepID=A0A183FTX6_HELPZ|nr:unnamed protein product [Heligmosomoides polygyrus]
MKLLSELWSAEIEGLTTGWLYDAPGARVQGRRLRVSGTVYLITCIECEEEYIGDTARSLGVREKEHVDGLNRCKVATPLWEHRLRSHSGAVIGVAVTTLARQVDIAAHKALEALNRKEERVAVNQKLDPFANLCGFTPQGASQKVAEGLTRREGSFIIHPHLFPSEE